MGLCGSHSYSYILKGVKKTMTLNLVDEDVSCFNTCRLSLGELKYGYSSILASTGERRGG
jgi:hypothetical protein